jgi:uncharacterized membrane protein YphA (DoxX/SURF4 family)
MDLRRVLVWIVSALLALEFVLAGVSKLTPASGWSRMFLAWGYPSWFRFVVGTVEALCGLALFIPRARAPAIGTLLAIMAGATATHLVHGEPRRVILTAALSALLGLLMLVQSRDSRSA